MTEVPGAGRLSPRALARLDRAQRLGSPALRPPPADDHRAVAAWRAGVHAAWLAGDPPAEACGHRQDEIAGVRVLRTDPDPSAPLAVYCHGGGFALGSPEVALPITERLAGRVEVVSVDYRLAPEHPCPAAIDDVTAVVDALARSNPGRDLALVGDSAGANLALSVALAVGGTVGAVVLFSPHVDHRPEPGPTAEGGHDRPSDLDADGARWLADAYRGPLPLDDPRLSPARAELAALPPLLLQVGTRDTTFEQAVRLARRARTDGVAVDLDVWEGLWHTWHYHRDLPEADRAIDEAASFLHRHARSTGPGPSSGNRPTIGLPAGPA